MGFFNKPDNDHTTTCLPTSNLTQVLKDTLFVYTWIINSLGHITGKNTFSVFDHNHTLPQSDFVKHLARSQNLPPTS